VIDSDRVTFRLTAELQCACTFGHTCGACALQRRLRAEARTTLRVPPPPSLSSLRAAARERLDALILDAEAEGPTFPASFAAPCARCGRPRLSATEALCAECEVES